MPSTQALLVSPSLLSSPDMETDGVDTSGTHTVCHRKLVLPFFSLRLANRVPLNGNGLGAAREGDYIINLSCLDLAMASCLAISRDSPSVYLSPYTYICQRLGWTEEDKHTQARASAKVQEGTKAHTSHQ
jgi:hypothetical protein